MRWQFKSLVANELAVFRWKRSFKTRFVSNSCQYRAWLIRIYNRLYIILLFPQYWTAIAASAAPKATEAEAGKTVSVSRVCVTGVATVLCGWLSVDFFSALFRVYCMLLPLVVQCSWWIPLNFQLTGRLQYIYATTMHTQNSYHFWSALNDDGYRWARKLWLFSLTHFCIHIRTNCTSQPEYEPILSRYTSHTHWINGFTFVNEKSSSLEVCACVFLLFCGSRLMISFITCFSRCVFAMISAIKCLCAFWPIF